LDASRSERSAAWAHYLPTPSAPADRLFFGFLFDATKSYLLSFSIFIGLLFASAVLSIFLRPPKK
jgi:hypothetical protein